jgi:3-oxoacyl-[acyl-carrier-protein] synthase II
MSVLTPIGLGLEAFWAGLRAGRNGVKAISTFDASGLDCRIAGEITDFDAKEYVDRKDRKSLKVMARPIQLAVACTNVALLRESKIDPAKLDPVRFGAGFGAGLIASELEEFGPPAQISANCKPGEVDLQKWGSQGLAVMPPLWMLKYLPNMLACHVTIIHDCRGPSNTITCCEASSGLSIGESVRVIQRGSADACLSGGAESKINPMAMMRQTFAGRLSPATEDVDPASVLRPFDAAASGTVIGEGGGLVVVEDAGVAAQRGRAPYAEITGFACTQSHCPDTVGLVVEPEGIADAVELALDRAGIGPEAVDAIAPLGSSIPAVDRAEAAAIERVFGARARQVPLITTIPNAGNCNAGAGTVAVAVAAMSLREQRLPARLNTAAGNGLDAAACPSRPAALRNVLVFQTSQGGQNVAMVLKKA